jgi:endonuclease YncB( thermonuclease family)
MTIGTGTKTWGYFPFKYRYLYVIIILRRCAMKKINILLTVIMILSVLIGNIAFAAEPIKVYVDNSRLDMEVMPQIQNGRTLVPLRAIFEALGAELNWDPGTRTVTGTKDGTVVTLTIDSKIAYINGSAKELDAPAVIVSGRTMVPARFIAESLGAQVGWDSNSKTVLVNSDINEIMLYKIVRIIDGDTLVASKNGAEETVRLIGVDTPEIFVNGQQVNDPQAVAALEYAKAALTGRYAELELDIEERDQYGRLLAYIWLDGIMLNKVLLENGIASVATYPPNVKYLEEFTALESIAKEKKLGIWGNPLPQPSEPVSNLFVIDKTKALSGPIGDPETAQYKGSIKSDKYHKLYYTHPGQISEENLIYFESLDHAIMNGYKPCGYCF